jgi:hypothetical protein
MKKNIAGEGIKGAQVFMILINIAFIVFLLVYSAPAPLFLGDIIFVLYLYHYIRLYSISIEGDYFIVENLFIKKKFYKNQCIGLRKISNVPFVVGIEFKSNKEFRFQLGSNASFQHMFCIGTKSAEDVLFDEIQAFIDSPAKEQV